MKKLGNIYWPGTKGAWDVPDSPEVGVRRSLPSGEMGQEAGDKKGRVVHQVVGGPLQGTSPSPLQSMPIFPYQVPTHSIPPPYPSSPSHTSDAAYPAMQHQWLPQ